MIHEELNFLSDEQCNFCINFFENSNEKSIFQTNYIVNLVDKPKSEDIFKIIKKKLTLHIHNIEKNCFINYSQIVKYLNGNKKSEHYDFDYHPYTSIIYLNDNYKGGETVVEDKIIKPVKGKILTFPGNKLIHKVNETFNERYTISTWYKKYE